MKKSKVIYTTGTFDLFHYGHVAFLRQCHKLGKVIAGLNSDKFILKYKGIPPVMNYKERKAVLESCVYVDRVINGSPNNEADDKVNLRKLKPDYWVIGSDWKNKGYLKQAQVTPEWLKKMGIKFCYIPYTKGISTTDIKKRLVRRQNGT
jgi:glycerol-3-phosphate cytidylyltransferase